MKSHDKRIVASWDGALFAKILTCEANANGDAAWMESHLQSISSTASPSCVVASGVLVTLVQVHHG